LRIVRNGRADPDQHRVDQGAQAMKVGKAGLAIDVVGVPAGGGNARVDRLPTLSHHDQIVDRAQPQWPENVLPGLGQGTIALPERCRDCRPGGVGRNFRTAAFIHRLSGSARAFSGKVEAGFPQKMRPTE